VCTHQPLHKWSYENFNVHLDDDVGPALKIMSDCKHIDLQQNSTEFFPSKEDNPNKNVSKSLNK
jgi:hypothetical protein